MSKKRLLTIAFLLSAYTVFAQETDVKKDSGHVKTWNEKINEGLNNFEKKGLDTSVLGLAFANNFFYEVVFTHTNDKCILRKSLKWMDQIIKKTPDDQVNLDTYANLHYKLGNTKKAIEIEQFAMKLEDEKAVKENRAPDNVFKETVEKMKKNIPTWPDVE